MTLPTLPNDARDGESSHWTSSMPRANGQEPNVGAKSDGQKAGAQTASMEQRS
jgi:hypothetical protein